MRRILIILLLILSAQWIYAQDLIVTNEGDSINCKITKVKAGNLYFTFKHKDEIRNTLLPKTAIKIYQFDYFQNSEVPKGQIAGSRDYQRFRVAINGGYSIGTAKVAESIPADFKDYVKKLKAGYHFGGDFTYYFTEILGLGLKYTLFKTSNSLDNIYLEDADGNRTYGKMSDNLKVSYIGPTFSTRFLNQNKSNAFLMNLSLGYMGYKDDKIMINSYKMTGNTLGLALDFGYDIGLSENFALGIQISLLTGTLFKYDWDDGIKTETIKLEKGEYESLNRIDFSVGLRFGK